MAQGLFDFSGNFSTLKAEPLDARMFVNTKAELTQLDSWPNSNGAPFIYKGMIVSVVEEDALYMLTDKLKWNEESSWKKVGSDGNLSQPTNLIKNSNFEIFKSTATTNQKIVDNFESWYHAGLGGSGTTATVASNVESFPGINFATIRYYAFKQNVELELGKTYTLSFVYTTGSTSEYAYVNYTHQQNWINVIDNSGCLQSTSGSSTGFALKPYTAGYKKASITFTYNGYTTSGSGNQNAGALLFASNSQGSGGGDGYLTIGQIKLEEGNTATDYDKYEDRLALQVDLEAFKSDISSVQSDISSVQSDVDHLIDISHDNPNGIWEKGYFVSYGTNAITNASFKDLTNGTPTGWTLKDPADAQYWKFENGKVTYPSTSSSDFASMSTTTSLKVDYKDFILSLRSHAGDGYVSIYLTRSSGAWVKDNMVVEKSDGTTVMANKYVSSSSPSNINISFYVDKDTTYNIIYTKNTSSLTVTNITIGQDMDGGAYESIVLSNIYLQVHDTKLLNTKQDKLVSGTNIKTINGSSLLGNGNITIDAESNYDSTLEDGLKTVKEVGGIPAGTTAKDLKGKSFIQLFDDILFPTDNNVSVSSAASVTNFAIDPTANTWCVVGDTDIDKAAAYRSTISNAGALNRGSWNKYNTGRYVVGEEDDRSYQLLYTSDSNATATIAVGTTETFASREDFNNYYVGTNVSNETDGLNEYFSVVNDNIKYLKPGRYTYKAVINYKAGDAPLNNKGNAITSLAKPKGSVSSTKDIYVSKPWYATTSSLSTLGTQAFVKWRENNDVTTAEITVVAQTSLTTLPENQRQRIRIPRTLKKLETYNSTNPANPWENTTIKWTMIGTGPDDYGYYLYCFGNGDGMGAQKIRVTY